MPYRSVSWFCSCLPILTIQPRRHPFSWPLPSSLQTVATSCYSQTLLRERFSSPKLESLPVILRTKSKFLVWLFYNPFPSYFLGLASRYFPSFLMLTAHAPISSKTLFSPCAFTYFGPRVNACLSRNTGFSDASTLFYRPFHPTLYFSCPQVWLRSILYLPYVFSPFWTYRKKL